MWSPPYPLDMVLKRTLLHLLYYCYVRVNTVLLVHDQWCTGTLDTHTHTLSIYTLSEGREGRGLCFCVQMSQDQNISARLVSML